MLRLQTAIWATASLMVCWFSSCLEPSEKTTGKMQQKKARVHTATDLYESTSGKMQDEKEIVLTATAVYDSTSGWGYDIFVDGKRYIHQPHIPAIPGRMGFQSEKDALKAADLVKKKIRNNILPPSLTISELDSLGVLHMDSGQTM